MQTEVVVEIEAPLPRVWEEVTDFASHVRWMRDARSIRVEPPGDAGVGSVLAIDTRVGPFRTMDRFKITKVIPMSLVAGRHRGLFTGEGRFELSEAGPGRTRFAWREQIFFPWYFGGGLGAWAAKPTLTRIWRSNLLAFKELVEGNPEEGNPES